MVLATAPTGGLPRSFLSLLATFADALDWTYDERLNRYRQASTGHFLSAESIIRLRDEFLDARIVRTRQLAADLADDRITLGEWERGMRDEIKTTVGVEYAFGRGGMNRMQPSDFREMGGLVGDHYRFLNNFAQDISTGGLSEAGIASRAAMYIGSGTTAYERGAASASQVALPVYPGEDCIGLTNCRCSWQLDPLEDGSTDAYWVAEADACDVCAQHAQDYDPLHFPPPVRPGRRAEAAPDVRGTPVTPAMAPPTAAPEQGSREELLAMLERERQQELERRRRLEADERRRRGLPAVAVAVAPERATLPRPTPVPTLSAARERVNAIRAVHEPRLTELTATIDRLAPLSVSAWRQAWKDARGLRPGTPEYTAALAPAKTVAADLESANKEAYRLRDEQTKAIRALIFHDTPADIRVVWEPSSSGLDFTPSDRKRITEGIEGWKRMVGPGVVDGQTIRVQRHAEKKGRAFYEAGAIHLDGKETASVTVHELGHWLEDTNPSAALQTLTHYTDRTAGERSRQLTDISPAHGFRPDEVSKPDRFADPYMGKDYGWQRGKTQSHELLSMSMQLLYEDPYGFLTKDERSWEYAMKLLHPHLARPVEVAPPPTEIERLALERRAAEQDAERLERERLAREEAARQEQARLERERQERLVLEQAERERLETERLERERLAEEQRRREQVAPPPEPVTPPEPVLPPEPPTVEPPVRPSPEPPPPPTPPKPTSDSAAEALRASVKEGSRSSQQIAGSDHYSVTFHDGTSAILRDLDAAPTLPGAARPIEALVYHVAQAIGFADMLPASIVVGSRVYTRRFEPGKQWWRANKTAQAELATPAGIRLGKLDYITGQTDRHVASWYVGYKHDLRAVDQRGAFGSHVASPFATRLIGQEMDRGEWRGYREALEAARAEADPFGMRRAYDAMIERVRYVEEHGRLDPSAFNATPVVEPPVIPPRPKVEPPQPEPVTPPEPIRPPEPVAPEPVRPPEPLPPPLPPAVVEPVRPPPPPEPTPPPAPERVVPPEPAPPPPPPATPPRPAVVREAAHVDAVGRRWTQAEEDARYGELLGLYTTYVPGGVGAPEIRRRTNVELANATPHVIDRLIDRALADDRRRRRDAAVDGDWHNWQKDGEFQLPGEQTLAAFVSRMSPERALEIMQAGPEKLPQRDKYDHPWNEDLRAAIANFGPSHEARHIGYETAGFFARQERIAGARGTLADPKLKHLWPQTQAFLDNLLASEYPPAQTNYEQWRKQVITDGWLVAGGSPAYFHMQEASMALPQNAGKHFTFQINGIAIKALEPTAIETANMKRLYDETQAFLRTKYKSPDGSKVVTIYRGTKGKTVTHSALESWTVDKYTAARYAKIYGEDDPQTMQREVAIKDILMSYDAAKDTEHGGYWFPEKQLKGKREYVPLTGAWQPAVEPPVRVVTPVVEPTPTPPTPPRVEPPPPPPPPPVAPAETEVQRLEREAQTRELTESEMERLEQLVREQTRTSLLELDRLRAERQRAMAEDLARKAAASIPTVGRVAADRLMAVAGPQAEQLRDARTAAARLSTRSKDLYKQLTALPRGPQRSQLQAQHYALSRELEFARTRATTLHAAVTEAWRDAVLFHDRPADVVVNWGTQRPPAIEQQRITKAIEDWRRMVGPGVIDGESVDVIWNPANKRAHYNLGQIEVGPGAQAATVVHELSHFLEDRSTVAADATDLEYRQRTKGEAAVPLKTVVPNSGFADEETTRPDKFADAYMGKDYGDARVRSGSPPHELLSMAAQHLYEDPVAFLDKDPASFDFAMRVFHPDLVERLQPAPPPPPRIVPPPPVVEPIEPTPAPVESTTQLRRSIDSGSTASKRIGTSDLYAVSFGDGSTAVMHTTARPVAALAATVARTIGMAEIAPPVVHAGTRSYTRFDPKGWWQARSPGTIATEAATADGVRIGKLDYITGHSDRHAGTWFIGPRHALRAVDQSGAFGDMIVSPFAERLIGQPMDKAEWRGYREALERTTLTAYGLAAERTAMLARIRYVEEHGRLDPSAFKRAAEPPVAPPPVEPTPPGEPTPPPPPPRAVVPIATAHADAIRVIGDQARITARAVQTRVGGTDTPLQLLQEAVGRPVTTAQLAALACAPEGSSVLVRRFQNGVRMDVTWPGHPVFEASRTLTRDTAGKLVVENRSLTTGYRDTSRVGNAVVAREAGPPPPVGFGTQLFARQVDAARQLGVSELHTTAAGHGAQAGYKTEGLQNGYYTWARLGYNGEIPPKVAALHPEAKDLNDLVLRGAASTLKTHGDEWYATFDLAPTSRSSQILGAYLAQHQVLPTPAEPVTPPVAPTVFDHKTWIEGAKPHAEAWRAALHPDVAKAFDDYRGRGEEVNEHLRSADPEDSGLTEIDDIADQVQAGLEQSTLHAPVTVRRDMLLKPSAAATWRKLEPGNVLQDRAFVSTTLNPDGVLGLGKPDWIGPGWAHVKLVIDAPAGAHGALIDQFDKATWDGKPLDELLLPRDTRLQVQSTEVSADGAEIAVHASVLHDTPAQAPAAARPRKASTIARDVLPLISPVTTRAFHGQPVPQDTKISKQALGALAENIGLVYLREFERQTGAVHANEEQNNFPVDLVYPRAVVEVKGGNIGNTKGAQQWRLTIGEPGDAEKALMAAMTPDELAAHNANKEQLILERKARVMKQIQEANGGVAPEARTIAVILDADRHLADVHIFKGFHERIGWTSQQAKEGYVGTFSYTLPGEPGGPSGLVPATDAGMSQLVEGPMRSRQAALFRTPQLPASLLEQLLRASARILRR